MDLFTSLVRVVVAESLLPRLDPSRWALLGAESAGLVFGRSLGDVFGLVLALVVEPDGGYRLAFVLAGDETPAPEADVRAIVARRGRQPYVPRVHAYEPSPVCSALCVRCACPVLDHERAIVEERVASAVGPLDYKVTFKGASAEVEAVAVRERRVPRPPLNPVPRPPGDVEAVVPEVRLPAPAWRPLDFVALESLKRLVAGGAAANAVTVTIGNVTSEGVRGVA